ncbi:MAG: hypothetical protein IJV29_13230, partial [Butyrivibrio sp.]|nr:hypothetical protein [Butyrivibrio sp.]
MRSILTKNWHKCLIAAFFVVVAIFYIVIGEDSYIAIHDNLDLFTPQFQMMKDNNIFFTQGASAPFLHGITRDGLPSELSLYTVLYMIFPSFTAYVIGYLLKIVIAMWSSLLLAKDVLVNEGLSKRYSVSALEDGFNNDKSGDGKKAGGEGKILEGIISNDTSKLAWLCSFAYGILNLFPTFGIPFASIPLAIYIFRNIYRNPNWKWYLAAFLYPFVSYFSYFGMFILGYVFVAIIWLWIRDAVIKKDVAGPRLFKSHLSVSLFIGMVLMAIGCVVFEYRLFSMMLFSDTVSIRSTMVEADLSVGEIISEIWDVFINGMMHADDAHKYLILPVCLIYFVILNVGYIVKKNSKAIFHDYFNLCMLVLVFNAVVYGIYDSSFFRDIVSTLVPQLTGWQFNRTIFFSPFVWYAALFIVCVRLVAYCKTRASLGKSCIRLLAYALPILAIFTILLQDNRYNDLRSSAIGQYYKIRHNGQSSDNLSYSEFYSTELFDQIKEDIGYEADEWALAYGLYPAVLEYNGISTLDGYLGFYSQEYKEAFRKIIAPALERSEGSRLYFDNWGARCYLYFGSDSSPNMATKSLVGLDDTNIYIDAEAIKALDGKYIFSRIELSNA